MKLKKWDSAEHLKAEQDIALYLQACIDEAGDDWSLVAKALVNVARARGMMDSAKETGLGRESLYKALSGEVNPSFSTVMKVMVALKLKLTITPTDTLIQVH